MSDKDTIYRQDAIDAVCSACGYDCDEREFVYNAPRDEQVIMCPEHYALSTLPSAQQCMTATSNTMVSDTVKIPVMDGTTERLPSAQPKHLVKESGDLVKDLVNDCISRQDAIKYFAELWECIEAISDREEWEDVCVTTVNEIKSAQLERPKGEWIIDGHHIKCNRCKNIMCSRDREGDLIPKNYCPNCGSYNGGKEDEIN